LSRRYDCGAVPVPLAGFKLSHIMRSTRFPQLGYKKIGRAGWLIFDLTTGGQIGSYYSSQIELLSDLERFAAERGYN
jgi:hypothetical protein